MPMGTSMDTDTMSMVLMYSKPLNNSLNKMVSKPMNGRLAVAKYR